MLDSVEALLTGAIDYAGLFPPARLGLAAALSEYRSLAAGRSGWILDRFVVGAAMLEPFASVLAAAPGEPLDLAVVGSSGPDWEEARASDAEAMSCFQARAGGLAEIAAYETRARTRDELERVAEAFGSVDVFAEVGWGDDRSDLMAQAAELELGVKARTGGTEASAFPSSEQLAGFLVEATQLDLAYKLTAGLHHALPRYDEPLGVRMHGFLNVFVAATLAVGEELSRREVEAILNIDEFSEFGFGESWAGAGGSRAGLDLIRQVRANLVGFGSCSVDEPLAELQALGLAGS